MRLTYGVGFNSGGRHKKSFNNIKTPVGSAWDNMLKRCYSKKHHITRPTYVGCSVVPEWHDFQVFAEWFENNYVDGYVLDKDILTPDNKVYGPDTCCFVPQEINALILDSAKGTRVLPQGVCYIKTRQHSKYKAQISIKGKQTHLGYFDTPELANRAYKQAKSSYITKTINEWKDVISSDVYNALENRLSYDNT